MNDTGPRVAEAIGKINGVVDVLNGVENTISGPSMTYQVNPMVAARAGFTGEEVAVDASAVLEGEPAATPLVINDRAYTIRVRFPDESRATLDRMSNTLLVSASGRTATLGSLASVATSAGETEIRRENLQRLVQVTGRLEGVDLGSGIAAVKKAVNDLHLPPSIRVEYGGLYEEQQNSFKDLLLVLLLAVLLLFAILAFEFRTFSAPIAILASALLSTFGGLVALLVTRTSFNVASFMGMIMVIGIVAKNGILLLDAEHRFRQSGCFPGRRDDSSWASPPPPHRDDSACDHRRHVAAGSCHRGRFADASAPCDYRGRRFTQLDGIVPDLHPGDSLLPATKEFQT